MVPVGNWTMPFQFGDGYKAEYMHAFEGTCITDFCCAEIYRMTGANAEKMQKITEFAAVGDCGFCEWKKEDGDVGCGLRYEEFISLCIDQIQKLKKRVDELETKLNTTQNDLTNLRR